MQNLDPDFNAGSFYISNMQILIAPDSFKDSISAFDAAKAIKNGLIKNFPDASFKVIPLSDGGEGFLDSIAQVKDIKIITTKVENPLQQLISTNYGMIKHEETAIIETAKTAGYQLIKKEQRNPYYTSTYGIGMQIKHALENGYRKFIIGIGGSATNDAGSGMLQALGMSIKDKNGQEIKRGGIYLSNVHSITNNDFHPAIKDSEFTIACDVNNPLTGPNGASMIYGPQKGATKEMCKVLDKSLKHFVNICKDQLGVDIDSKAGSGAAGGLGGAFMALFPSKTIPGIELISQMLDLDNKIKSADLIVTGEGQLDIQTFKGKAVSHIIKMAQKHKKPLRIIAGKINNIETCEREDIQFIDISELAGSIEESMTSPKYWISRGAENIKK